MSADALTIGRAAALASPNNPVPVTSGNLPYYDYYINTLTNGDATTTVYKVGGSSGTTVATVTRTFDGSHNLLTWTMVLAQSQY